MQTNFSLKVHEWLAIITVVAVISLLTSISVFSKKSISVPVVSNSEIEVIIKGAVQEPGVYKVKRGTVVGEAIAMAKTLPEANLERIKTDSTVRSGQVIKVPTQKRKQEKRKKREKTVEVK